MAIQPEQIAEAGAAQRRAASDGNSHVRLVAGLGTGKSFTVEDRICWLLTQGEEPRSIAAVSFTRASAFDLQTRVRRACVRAGHPDAQIGVTTLHSLALRSLRAAGILAAYPVDPLVLDHWELENVFDEEFGSVASVRSIPRRREIRGDHEAFWGTGRHYPRPSQRPPDPPISEAERTQFRQFHTPRTQYLEAEGCPSETLVRYEFVFFRVLDDHRTPRALFGALTSSPSLFVDLVQRVYRGKNEPRRRLDEHEEALAHHASWILLHWRDLPGRREDRTVDGENLHAWVKDARLALAESDRADIGDEQIGQVLAMSPPGADGIWPAEPVRDIIETIGSPSIETGIHVGRVNARGATSRGVFDGGGLERKLAA